MIYGFYWSHFGARSTRFTDAESCPDKVWAIALTCSFRNGSHEISHQTLSFGSFPALCASRKMEFFINEDCDMVMGQDRSSATTASLHLESSSSNSLVSFADSLDALSFSSISGDDSG